MICRLAQGRHDAHPAAHRGRPRRTRRPDPPPAPRRLSQATPSNYARHLPGVRRILTIDDLLTELPRKQPSCKAGLQARQRLQRIFRYSTRAVVGTRPLADLCAEMIDDGSCPTASEWAVGATCPAAAPAAPQTPRRLGWRRGTWATSAHLPGGRGPGRRVDWIFMGMCPDASKPFVRESQRLWNGTHRLPKAGTGPGPSRPWRSMPSTRPKSNLLLSNMARWAGGDLHRHPSHTRMPR